MTKQQISQADWAKAGKELYGENFLMWRFVCPMCGNVQTPADFQELGVENLESAAQECIGRHLPKAQVRPAFRETLAANGGIPAKPCDYAAYGLLRFAPLQVMVEGKPIECFAFADEPNPDQNPVKQ